MNLSPLKSLPEKTTAPPGKEAFMAAGADCVNCPLSRHRAVRSDLGRSAAPSLVLVGEAPGKREVSVGRVFVGKSGELLNYALKQAGIVRADIAIVNAISCGPIASDNEIVKHAAMHACRPRLIQELRTLSPKGVLAIGAKALAALAPEGSSGVTALRGALLPLAADVTTEEWHPPFFSTFHPAHILRGGDGDNDGPDGEDTSSVDLLYYFLLFDLAKAYRFANGQTNAWEDDLDLFVDQGGALHRVAVVEGIPSVAAVAQERELILALERVIDEAKKHGELTCDVETDGKDSLEANLTAISYGTPDGAVSATWASWQMFPKVMERLKQLHADRKQRWNWQNGIFDRVVLRRHKLAIAGPSEDTLLKHHGAFPGLPHKLDQIAAQFFVTSPWKNEFRTSTRNLAELVLYNGRDVVCTAKISHALNRFLKEARTERVYETDRQINVVATRMREVGMYIDRAEQERHRTVQTARLEYMREALTKDFATIEEDWRQALARLLADKSRKKDPEAYLERVELRYREIAERDRKPTDIGLFKPKAKADIVALFMILRIPFTDYTPKGAPVTDKKAMEGAAARHPLMRRLIHVREAQHLIATYIDLPIKRDGRMHPDWKAIDITTPILTASGWKTMGTVAVGDRVFAPDGTLTAITYISPIGVRQALRVVFDDRAEIVVDNEHLWPVFKQGKIKGQMRVVATKYLSRRMRMPRSLALVIPVVNLPIDPYVMGAWLGDGAKDSGTLHYALSDLAVPIEFARRGYQASSTRKDPRSNCKSAYYPRLYAELKRSGFIGLREIPEVYLISAKEQRSDLLRGILDTDGSASIRGQVSFSSVHERLAHQVLFLARSLGYRAGICESKVRIRGVDHGSQFQVFWEGWGPTFGMPRKQARIRRSQPNPQACRRWVTLIEPVDPRAVRCIAVDHPSHCYVVGRDLIVTHNTTKITGRWGAGKSQNVPNNVAGWPPEVDAEGNFRVNALGSFITPRENMRSIITAPTAEQVLTVADRAPGLINPWVLARAKRGFGRKLIGADLDQVELRILAFLSKDPFLLGIFNEGRDPHAEFSNYIFPDHFPKLVEEIKAAGFKPKNSDAVEDELVRLEGRSDDIALARTEKLRSVLKAQKQWKRLRDFTKRVEYGGAYRGKPLTIWTALVKDMPEVELANVEHGINVFYEKANMVPRWHNDQETRARLYRESREALLGRVRLFPLGNFSPTIVVNFPIQSYGASLVSLAIFRFTVLTHPELLELDRLYKFGLLDAKWVREMKAKGFGVWKAPVELLSNGHDSLLAEADVEDAERVKVLLASAMTQEVVDRDGTRMTYSAKAKVSQRWSRT